MNQRGVFVLLISIFLFLAVGSVFTFAINNKTGNNSDNDLPYIEGSNETISCLIDDDCDDGNSCTIDYCAKEKCSNTQVVLCYQNDGCCPKGCLPGNDNDCVE